MSELMRDVRCLPLRIVSIVMDDQAFPSNEEGYR